MLIYPTHTPTIVLEDVMTYSIATPTLFWCGCVPPQQCHLKLKYKMKQSTNKPTVQSFDAIILTIDEEARPKSNGKHFLLCEVEFKSGALLGKKFFANRTLGLNKTEISVGQDVQVLLSFAERDGVKRPFFEISTSRVASAEEIMDLLGA